MFYEMVIAQALNCNCEKLKSTYLQFFVEKLGHLDSLLEESEGSSLGVYVSLVRGGRTVSQSLVDEMKPVGWFGLWLH